MSASTELFAAIDRHVRRPTLAQIGGFRPEPGLRSWFGGGFYRPPTAPWPTSDGQAMIPLLQVVTTELPFVPGGLSGMDVLQVFASSRLPVGTPVANGSGFAVQSLRATDLEPRKAPFPYAIPRPFPIRWLEGREEGPSWEDVHGLVSHELIMEFVKDEGCFKAYYDRYAPQHATKLGGWPSYIQGAPGIDGSFVLQIASEEKPRWMVGDNGTMYFFQDDADWSLHWDCY